MNTYKFELLDPRNLPAAQTANDAIFALGPILGIEVTVPALAARCTLGNIDPQHTEGKVDLAAIEVVREIDLAFLPQSGAVLATVRADLDSVGAMALLGLLSGNDGRVFGKDSGLLWKRVEQVARADKFAQGDYAGPQPLPTAENPWPSEGAADSTNALAAIGAAVGDFKVSLADRVATMEKWLLTGEEPTGYRERVEKERQELIRALADGTIRHKRVEFANGALALVESTHRAATTVGYAQAPVVVALNPSFKLGAGEPHRKFTVCAYSAGHADIKSALAELAALESGWGGSPTIGGSPQGVSSTLSVEQVVEVVSRYLK